MLRRSPGTTEARDGVLRAPGPAKARDAPLGNGHFRRPVGGALEEEIGMVSPFRGQSTPSGRLITSCSPIGEGRRAPFGAPPGRKPDAPGQKRYVSPLMPSSHDCLRPPPVLPNASLDICFTLGRRWSIRFGWPSDRLPIVPGPRGSGYGSWHESLVCVRVCMCVCFGLG